MSSAAEPACTAAAVRFTALGLDVEDHAGLAGTPAGGVPTGRPLAVREHTARLVGPPPTERISTRLRDDGRLELAIGRDAAGDFWFDAPGAGRYRLRADGRLLETTGPQAGALRDRMLVAQALPFAALLQGLEVLHASAVARDGGAIAVTGPSGAGKTSVALALVRRGARLIADDALALETTADAVIAHPALGTANVRHADAERLGDAGLAALGREIARDAWSVRVAVHAAQRRPAPLRALYVLRRAAAHVEPTVREVDPPDPRLLLGATINLCLRTPQRLRGHLELCARAAADVRLREVRIPPSATPADTAAAIDADLRSAA